MPDVFISPDHCRSFRLAAEEFRSKAKERGRWAADWEAVGNRDLAAFWTQGAVSYMRHCRAMLYLVARAESEDSRGGAEVLGARSRGLGDVPAGVCQGMGVAA